MTGGALLPRPFLPERCYVKLHTCKVRLAGQVQDQVEKTAVTAAEMHVLRVIHGEDAITDIVETGDVDRSEAMERDRLEFIYSEDLIRRVFGATVARIGDGGAPARVEPPRPARPKAPLTAVSVLEGIA